MIEGVTARLFDADGHDRVVDLETLDLGEIGDRCLLWIDLDLDAGASLDAVADRVSLSPRRRERLEADSGRARMDRSSERIHLTLEAMETPDETGADAPDDGLVRREIDLIATPGVVVSVHRGAVAALERFVDGIAGETVLGALDAADLLSSLADEVISGYYDVAERIEQDIDRLDQAALDGDPSDMVLARIVNLRRRIGLVRRTLAPHRAALTALGRPEMEIEAGVGQPWPGLVDRLEGAMSAVDALRDTLLGTHDIFMGRAAQRANDVTKVLTLLSAVLLPAVVLAGVMGMNFALPFFDQTENFFVVIGAMALFAIGLLVLARWRRWI